MLTIRDSRLVLRSTTAIRGLFNPQSLFASGEQGFWFDPSPETCFTTPLGTTPASAGGTVGLMLDKSQGLALGPELISNGGPFVNTTGWATFNGATVSVVNSRLRVSGNGVNSFPLARIGFSTVIGRRYLASATAFFVSGSDNNSYIEKSDNSTSVPLNNVNSLVEAAGAKRLIFTATATTTYLRLVSIDSNDSNDWDNISVRELPGNHATQATLANRPILGRKPRGGSRNLLRQTAILGTQTRPVTAAQHTLSFRGTGTVTLSGASTAGPLVGTGADDVVSLTFTPTAGNLTLTVSGTVNDAQLELGSVRSTYQLVADASGFDITEAGKADCWYLYGGGVADPRWMQTPTITPNTDKVQVFAGVRKLSDANRASVVEMSTTIASNNGAFLMTAPDTSASYAFATKGDVNSTSDISGFTAPITNVVTGLGDISGDSAVLRLNGSQVAQNTSDQGAGNYLAYPAYIMSRAGTSLFFNGEIYALATRFGPNMNVRTIERFERWIANLVAEDTIP
jgi:hypothetical protein